MLVAVYMSATFRQKQPVVVAVSVCLYETVEVFLPPVFRGMFFFLFVLSDARLVFGYFYAFSAYTRECRAGRTVAYEFY
jgi:hypothetical protein